jgi:hypothetical protein
MVTDLLLSSSVLAWLVDTNTHTSSINAADAQTQRLRELMAPALSASVFWEWTLFDGRPSP